MLSSTNYTSIIGDLSLNPILKAFSFVLSKQNFAISPIWNTETSNTIAKAS